MGKITGFLEIERHDRDYAPVEERIHHWHARVGRHLRNRVVRIRPQHNHIHPALHILRHIGNRLALAQR